MNQNINNLKIHTIELTYYLSQTEYKQLLEYFFSQKKKCYKEKSNSIAYNGFTNKGIRIKLSEYASDELLSRRIYSLKYIITLGRYIDNENYLELVDIDKAVNLLEGIGSFLSSEYYLLPKPMECKMTRIDFTKDIYVGENISYIIGLLNRCYIPYDYERNFGNKNNNATFTKRSLNKNKKIFELSFYDKYREMTNHIKNSKYQYSREVLAKARGILRVEFRFYNSRLKNMKKTYEYNTIQEFFGIITDEIGNIINKNLKSLYLIGNFFKLDDIDLKIETSYLKKKTKKLMNEFIELSVKHKSADKAATKFEGKYGEEKLKNIMKAFNNIGIIPVPIAVRQNFDEWGFME